MSVARCPGAVGRRRPFLERLPTLGLSPLGNLDGIANESYGLVETLTWETATDWDNATSESGVAHESVTNTDHGDDTIVQQGYTYGSGLDADLAWYYPLHEDSGSTAYALVSQDGTYNGPTPGTTAPLGTTAPDFDGTDDYVDVPDNSFGFSDKITASAWVNVDDVTLNDKNRAIWAESASICNLQVLSAAQGSADGDARFEVNVSGNWNAVYANSSVISANTWHLLTGVYDGSTGDHLLYVDGSQVGSTSTSGNLTNSSARFNIGARGDGAKAQLNGQMWDARVYGAAKSASHVQGLYDAVGTAGTLTTATKTFSSAFAPDLASLDYTLDGATDVQLDIIGSPGTASEEVVTQQLDGGTSYTLSWSNTHSDFRLKMYPDNEGTVTRNPTVNSLTLTTQ